MFFIHDNSKTVKPIGAKGIERSIEIKISDRMKDLQECIQACDTLGLPFTIVKRNVGGEENPCYLYFFYIKFQEVI